MEQVNVSVDYTKARVRFVREASQNEFASLSVQINFLVDNKFIVRYGIRQNKIVQILFDCYEFPNSNTLETMQKYLSIDDLKDVHIVVPEKDNKISIWLWSDVVKRVQENNREKEEVVKSITKKEVSTNVKSKENNLQNKPRRNKTVKKDIHVESGEVGCTLECYHKSFSKCSLKDVSFHKKTGNCLDYVPAKKYIGTSFECHNPCVHKSDDDHCMIDPSFNKFKECLFYKK